MGNDYPEPRIQHPPWRGVIALAPLQLDPSIMDAVGGVLNRYGLKTSSWLHISLRLLLQDRHLEQAAGFLGEMAKEYPPFTIQISGAACFPSSSVVYLRVRADPEMLRMRREIFLRQGWPGILAGLRNLTWIPHITIAYKVDQIGWDVAHELNKIVSGNHALVNTIVLRNWQDQDRCFDLGTGSESCISLVLPEDGG